MPYRKVAKKYNEASHHANTCKLKQIIMLYEGMIKKGEHVRIHVHFTT